MKEEFKYNLTSYLITHNRKQIILSFIIFIGLIIFVFLSFKYTIYNIEKTNAKTICNQEECTINFYHYGISKEDYQFIKIKDKKYEIIASSFSEPTLDNTNTIIQEVTLKLQNYKGINNEIVEIKVYKNKEKKKKKIMDIIVER